MCEYAAGMTGESYIRNLCKPTQTQSSVACDAGGKQKSPKDLTPCSPKVKSTVGWGWAAKMVHFFVALSSLATEPAVLILACLMMRCVVSVVLSSCPCFVEEVGA